MASPWRRERIGNVTGKKGLFKKKGAGVCSGRTKGKLGMSRGRKTRTSVGAIKKRKKIKVEGTKGFKNETTHKTSRERTSPHGGRGKRKCRRMPGTGELAIVRRILGLLKKHGTKGKMGGY